MTTAETLIPKLEIETLPMDGDHVDIPDQQDRSHEVYHEPLNQAERRVLGYWRDKEEVKTISPEQGRLEIEQAKTGYLNIRNKGLSSREVRTRRVSEIDDYIHGDSPDVIKGRYGLTNTYWSRYSTLTKFGTIMRRQIDASNLGVVELASSPEDQLDLTPMESRFASKEEALQWLVQVRSSGDFGLVLDETGKPRQLPETPHWGVPTMRRVEESRPAEEQEIIEMFTDYVYSDEPSDEPTWRASSSCSQSDPDIFYPEKGGSTSDAKKVCGRCAVTATCLLQALSGDERFGIWGGLSERERRRLKQVASVSLTQA